MTISWFKHIWLCQLAEWATGTAHSNPAGVVMFTGAKLRQCRDLQSFSSRKHKSTLKSTVINVGKTIINHPFGNGLYHLLMVKLGMFYYCFTTISCFLRGSYSSLAKSATWQLESFYGILEGKSKRKHEHLQVKKCSIWCGQCRISVSKLCEKAEQCENLIIHSRFNFIVSNPNQYTLVMTNRAIENEHRNSGFSH